MLSNDGMERTTVSFLRSLLQNCVVDINTLMMQQILSRPQWAKWMTPVDLRALTPLVWEHVNPYGR